MVRHTHICTQGLTVSHTSSGVLLVLSFAFVACRLYLTVHLCVCVCVCVCVYTGIVTVWEGEDDPHSPHAASTSSEPRVRTHTHTHTHTHPAQMCLQLCMLACPVTASPTSAQPRMACTRIAHTYSYVYLSPVCLSYRRVRPWVVLTASGRAVTAARVPCQVHATAQLTALRKTLAAARSYGAPQPARTAQRRAKPLS